MNKIKTIVNQGFTLVELMVVLVIIAILMAFSVPEVINAIPNLKLKSMSYELLSLTQRARSLAVKNNNNVRLFFFDDSTNSTTGIDSVSLQEDTALDGSYSTDVLTKTFSYLGSDYDLIRVVSAVNPAGTDPVVDPASKCGSATATWNTSSPDGSSATEMIFYPKGTASSASIFIDNGESDDSGKNKTCYAITSVTTGSVKVRKYLEGKGWSE